MKHLLPVLLLCASAATAGDAPWPNFTFSNIDGGTHATADWAGQPVLVTNTASMCGFTSQFEQLQELHEAYGPKGLVVLAVPSDDFNQEKDSAAEVKDFCEMTYGITLPMTDITPVRGSDAHPFYQWLAETERWQPRWNFYKVLIGADGTVLGTWGSTTKPDSRRITKLIEAELAKGG